MYDYHYTAMFVITSNCSDKGLITFLVLRYVLPSLFSDSTILTHLVVKTEFCGQIAPMPWLLMLWFLGFPGNQPPCHWSNNISKPLSCTGKNINCQRDLSIEESRKYGNICLCFLNKFSTKTLVDSTHSVYCSWRTRATCNSL